MKKTNQHTTHRGMIAIIMTLMVAWVLGPTAQAQSDNTIHVNVGEAVTITKRGLQFATLVPARERKALAPIDRLARLRKMFPQGPVKGDVQDVLAYDRGNT